MIRTLIMAKAPIPGTIKTRLRLPPEEAARLQAALISDAAEKALALSLGPVTVAGTPPDRLGQIGPLLPPGVRLFGQAPGELGEKMLAGARRLFEEGSDPVLILGTDAPSLPPESIRRSARALAGDAPHDVAIIGSEDGSYVLLGLRGPHGGLFRGVSWSTDAVYRQTLEGARSLGLRVHEGDPHYDVDTPDDLARLKTELGANPRLSPRVAAALGLR